MEKMMKAMEMIRQGMLMAEQAMAEHSPGEEEGSKPDVKEDVSEGEMPKEGMVDKKKMIVAMLKKKGM